MKLKPDTYYWAIFECRLVIIQTSPLNNKTFFTIGQDYIWNVSAATFLKEVSKEEVETAKRLADLVVAAKVLKNNE